MIGGRNTVEQSGTPLPYLCSAFTGKRELIYIYLPYVDFYRNVNLKKENVFSKDFDR